MLESADASAALAVGDRYGLRDKLPAAVMQQLAHGTGPFGEASPKIENRLVGSNRSAGEAAAEALALGSDAHWLADDWQREAREVAAPSLCWSPGRPAPRPWPG